MIYSLKLPRSDGRDLPPKKNLSQKRKTELHIGPVLMRNGWVGNPGPMCSWKRPWGQHDPPELRMMTPRWSFPEPKDPEIGDLFRVPWFTAGNDGYSQPTPTETI